MTAHISDDSLLIGKDIDSLSIEGAYFRENGTSGLTFDSMTGLALNRLGTDGDIVGLYKDTVKIGSIRGVSTGSQVSTHEWHSHGKISEASQKNTLFVDSTDNLLEWKDDTGTIKIVTLT